MAIGGEVLHLPEASSKPLTASCLCAAGFHET